MAEPRPPHVIVFSLGGTIAMTDDGTGRVVPALSGEQLVAAVPGLPDSGITVEVRDVRRLPSASLRFDDLLELAEQIRGLEGADGVVVTQGTDTIEETAYLLDLLHTGEMPVVVTGAMRNPSSAGADGPANLLAAVQTAAAPAARGLGCLVVFADQIHAARFVRKTHSTSTATFQSLTTGPLGWVTEGHPRLLTEPRGRLTLPPPGTPGTPVRARVPVVTMTLDDDGEQLALIEGRVDGLIVAGFGVGHVPEWAVDPLEKLAAQIPVILASRTGSGSTARATYAFPGSESDLLGRGLIGAGYLDPYKARILLRLLLASGATREEITEVFGLAGGAA